jgi:hypothetical protein
MLTGLPITDIRNVEEERVGMERHTRLVYGAKGSFHGLCRDLTDGVGTHATLAFGAFVGIYQMSLN